MATKPIRIGYARCSTAQQELQSQLDALGPVCKRIFSEKIFTRVKARPDQPDPGVNVASRQLRPDTLRVAGSLVTGQVHAYERCCTACWFSGQNGG